MEEQLISFGTAKLAKEKGFDEPVYAIYSGNQLGIFTENDTIFNKWNHCRDATYSAPTQSLLQKWLREKHSIDVLVDKGFLCDNYSHEIYHKNDMFESEYIFKTYEKALEKGLYEALKLI